MRIAGLVLLMAGVAGAQGLHPRDAEIHDADTKAWWHTTEALSGDAMEGRDTGSAAYGRAAAYVAGRFKAAGLQPAGEGGGYFQQVPMREVAVDKAGTSFALVRDGKEVAIPFLEQITIQPAVGLEGGEWGLTFRGYCGKEAMADVAGKVVVCFGTQRAGLPGAGERVANARAGKAAGVLTVDDPYFTIEPPRWPAVYARAVSAHEGMATAQMPRGGGAMLLMRTSDEIFAELLRGSGQDAGQILRAGGAKEKLPSFEIAGRLRVKLQVRTAEYASPNVLGMLPGTDAALTPEVVVIAAHLDGYGYGEPVAGDALYNGALDDAAYVALLLQYADDLKAKGTKLKRSVLFAAWTGEEKGLLGSTWFTQHPTVGKDRLVADVNLDQLRPLFPLTLLTALAVDDTTLGTTVRAVGAGMGIRIQADPEPERGLIRRADHAPFLKIGVPAIGFIFGYEPGTDAEKKYREWYQVRYHRPQDDLTQPIDFAAAGKFNRFFYKLVETVADAAKRPEFVVRAAVAPAE